jgi:hypothetical protein
VTRPGKGSPGLLHAKRASSRQQRRTRATRGKPWTRAARAPSHRAPAETPSLSHPPPSLGGRRSENARENARLFPGRVAPPSLSPASLRHPPARKKTSLRSPASPSRSGARQTGGTRLSATAASAR